VGTSGCGGNLESGAQEVELKLLLLLHYNCNNNIAIKIESINAVISYSQYNDVVI